ncbi:MAG TPA: hypothetical protein VH684_17335 [Xanthobacteraceae bacterium]|jgi:hypothetical protein
MRHLTLAAATLAALALASTAYADSNYGPRQQGNKCFVHQNGNSLGYWGPCKKPEQSAARTSAPATANNTGTRRR